MCPRPLASLVACLTLGVVAVGVPASAQTKTYRVYDTFTDPQEPRNLQNHPPDIRPDSTRWRWANGEGRTLVLNGVVKNYEGTTREAWMYYSELRDAVVAVDYTSASSSPHGGLMFRHVDSNEYFMLEANGPTLYRYDNGYLQYMGSGSKTVRAGERHRLGVRLEGATIDVFFDEAFQFRVSDWTYADGAWHGFYYDAPNDPNASFDNFEISYLVPKPPCTYSVSPLGQNISADQFSGTVTVTAPPDCAWNAWSEADFINLVDTGGSGSGTIRYSVENSTRSEPRSGTFNVADSTITITQAAVVAPPAAPPSSGTPTEPGGSTPSPVPPSPGTGSPGSPGSPGGGGPIAWSANVPNGKNANSCWGNCGAACSDKPNPCGGPSYWTNAWLNQPQYVDDNYQVPSCAGGTVIVDVYLRYAISGRWTYHGRSSDGCRLHDNICRALGNNPAGFLGCFLAAVLPGSAYCSGARDENWSYTYVLDGHSQQPVRTIISTQPCYTEL